MELVSYGRAGAEQGVTAPSCAKADGGLVCYEWDETLTEWYVNDPRGLEHGYTVSQRLGGFTGGTPVPPLTLVPPLPVPHLQFTLAVRGALRPRVSDDRRNVTFVNDSGAAVVNYHGPTVHDADGAALPAWFEPAGAGLRLSVDDRSARYPLTIDPIAQQAYLKASNTDAGDRFGASVAVSGDTVVVGAAQEASNATGVDGDQADNSAFASGAAYVFVRSGTTWSQQAFLKASNTGAVDAFGSSVAVSGDTVVVGALQERSNATGVDGNQADNSAFGAGAAYVFAMDTDGDGVFDPADNCPGDANADQADADSDGVGDGCDGCPADPNKIAPGGCGCGTADTDTDGDGTADCNDNCPEVANADQADSDGNGVGDACEPAPAGQQPPAGDCCGGGMDAMMMPMTLLGIGWMRRRRSCGRR